MNKKIKSLAEKILIASVESHPIKVIENNKIVDNFAHLSIKPEEAIQLAVNLHKAFKEHKE